jgi:hypothetical protein
MLNTRRTIVFALCTVVSSVGGLAGAWFIALGAFSCVGVSTTVEACGPMPLLWVGALAANVAAWLCYFGMGFLWVHEEPAPRWLPVAGTALALAYFVPFALLPGTELESMVKMAVLVVPAMVLALYIASVFLLSPARHER